LPFSRQAQQVLVVPAEGVDYASPELLATLEEFHIKLVAYDTGVSEAVESGEVEVGLLLSDDFSDSLAAGQSAPLQLLSNPLGGFFSSRYTACRRSLRRLSSQNGRPTFDR